MTLKKMKLITKILFLMTAVCMLSCDCEEEMVLKIECPCIFKEEQPPYYKSCEEMGEDEERWKCMTNTILEKIYPQLEYPEEAKNECIEGTVVVAIIIDEKGYVLRTEIRNDPLLGYGLEDSALKVVSLLNDNWCPGLLGCEPVESEFVYPIKYKLAK